MRFPSLFFILLQKRKILHKWHRFFTGSVSPNQTCQNNEKMNNKKRKIARTTCTSNVKLVHCLCLITCTQLFCGIHFQITVYEKPATAELEYYHEIEAEETQKMSADVHQTLSGMTAVDIQSLWVP